MKQINDDQDDNNSSCRKVEFIVEQLCVLEKHKFGHQYTPQLTVLSYIIHAASSSAYATLRDEDVLSLLSVRTLQK